MHPPRHLRWPVIDHVLSLGQTLVLAAALAAACGLATTAVAAEDKDKDKDKAVAEALPKTKAAVAETAGNGKSAVESPARSKATDGPAKTGAASITIAPPTTGAPTITITGSTSTDSSDATADSAPATGKRFPRRRAHVQIGDDDFDSFNEALHTAPWVVGLAFLVAGTVFLTPIILLFGVIWYKLRKTRLQNDAVLKLAERGVMPTAQAVDAVMSGISPEAAAASATPIAGAAAPVYQQAVISRRKAVWSDLRKGVILSAIGLAFVFYSMINSSEANWVGLVLLFLGVGYVLLWWFEDRHLQRREADIRAGAGVDVGNR